MKGESHDRRRAARRPLCLAACFLCCGRCDGRGTAAAAAAAAARRRPSASSTAASASSGAAPSVVMMTSSTTTATSTATTTPSTTDVSTPSSTASSTTTTDRCHRRAVADFLRRFESRGPTLTLTMRGDPLADGVGGGVASVDGGSSWVRSLLDARPGGRRAPPPAPAPAVAAQDDGAFGLYSKLAEVLSVPTDAGGGNSNSRRQSSHFAGGYMLDDGDVLLDPPVPSSRSDFSPSATGGSSLLSMRGVVGDYFRDANDVSGSATMLLSDLAERLHPEVRCEVWTREPSPSSDGDYDDTRPFPDALPRLSALYCGVAWSPFPSAPRRLHFGARATYPRLSTLLRRWRTTSGGITSAFTTVDDDGDADGRPTLQDLDLDVRYHRGDPRRDGGGGGGSLDLRLGRSISSPSSSSLGSTCAIPPLSERERVRTPHVLLRVATGRNGHGGRGRRKNNGIRSATSMSELLSRVEYAGASFRVPAPSFLRGGKHVARNVGGGGGMLVSPSYDFGTEVARCVVSGDVGSSGRTRAVLRLDAAEDSTLTLVRDYDDGSKIIAPTISLNSGKIVYDYYLNLDGVSKAHATGQQGQRDNTQRAGSSLRAHVDPTKGILLKWTDGIRGGGGKEGCGGDGGCWVTECRIPLGTTGPSPLAADVRVGRRWVI